MDTDTIATGSDLIPSGFGKQFDGAYVAALGIASNTGLTFADWNDRTVADLNGVSFAERRSHVGAASLGSTTRRVIGFLDHASFGIWMQENHGNYGNVGLCCEWSVENHVTVADTRAVKYFDLGTYTWRGSMVGVEKRHPTAMIMGDAPN